MLSVLYGTSYDDPSLTASALGVFKIPGALLRFAAAPERRMLVAHLTGTEGHIAARKTRPREVAAVSNEAGLGALVQEIRQASENIASGDAATARRFEKLEAKGGRSFITTAPGARPVRGTGLRTVPIATCRSYLRERQRACGLSYELVGVRACDQGAAAGAGETGLAGRGWLIRRDQRGVKQIGRLRRAGDHLSGERVYPTFRGLRRDALARFATEQNDTKKAKARGRIEKMKAKQRGDLKKMPLSGKAALDAIRNG